MRKYLTVIVLLLFIGCNPAKKQQQDTMNYFDIEGYFKKEALRLNSSNPTLSKTVEVNGQAETKRLQLTDWTKEFAVFSGADINRNAWKGLFRTENNSRYDRYQSDHEKVQVKEVLITRANGKISGIRILIRYSNVLYTSADTLSYFPDSLYQVKKGQHITLLPEKHYVITGKFK